MTSQDAGSSNALGVTLYPHHPDTTMLNFALSLPVVGVLI